MGRVAGDPATYPRDVDAQRCVATAAAQVNSLSFAWPWQLPAVSIGLNQSGPSADAIATCLPVEALLGPLVLVVARHGVNGRPRAYARYADKHASEFGRIELIIVDGRQIRRIDLKDEVKRGKFRPCRAMRTCASSSTTPEP